jgi:hypothetical protein
VRVAFLSSILFVFLAGCVSGPKADDLRAEPALGVTYPDDIEMAIDAADPGWALTHSYPGHVTRRLASQASQADLLAFYDESFRSAGWEPTDGYVSGRCAGRADTHWRKGDLKLGIGWVDALPFYFCGLTEEELAKYVTVYEITLQSTPSE